MAMDAGRTRNLPDSLGHHHHDEEESENANDVHGCCKRRGQVVGISMGRGVGLWWITAENE